MDEPTCRAIANKLESSEPVIMEDMPALPVPVISFVPDPDVPKMKEVAEPVTLQSSDDNQLDSKDTCNVWIRTTHVGSLPRPADGILDLKQAPGIGARWSGSCLGMVILSRTGISWDSLLFWWEIPVTERNSDHGAGDSSASRLRGHHQ